MKLVKLKKVLITLTIAILTPMISYSASPGDALPPGNGAGRPGQDTYHELSHMEKRNAVFRDERSIGHYEAGCQEGYINTNGNGAQRGNGQQTSDQLGGYPVTVTGKATMTKENGNTVINYNDLQLQQCHPSANQIVGYSINSERGYSFKTKQRIFPLFLYDDDSFVGTSSYNYENDSGSTEWKRMFVQIQPGSKSTRSSNFYGAETDVHSACYDTDSITVKYKRRPTDSRESTAYIGSTAKDKYTGLELEYYDAQIETYTKNGVQMKRVVSIPPKLILKNIPKNLTRVILIPMGYMEFEYSSGDNDNDHEVDKNVMPKWGTRYGIDPPEGIAAFKINHLELKDAAVYYRGNPVPINQEIKQKDTINGVANQYTTILSVKWSDSDNYVFAGLERLSNGTIKVNWLGEYDSYVENGVHKMRGNRLKQPDPDQTKEQKGSLKIDNQRAHGVDSSVNQTEQVFTDSRVEEKNKKNGVFEFPGKIPDTVHITATYDADKQNFSAGLQFKPNNVRITALDETGRSSIIIGSSANVGLTMLNTMPNGSVFEIGSLGKLKGLKGDVDGNLVLNQTDLDLMKKAQKNPASVIGTGDQLTVFTTYGDLNGDKQIDEKDIKILEKIVNRRTLKPSEYDDWYNATNKEEYTYPYGAYTFYASLTEYTDPSQWHGKEVPTFGRLNNDIDKKNGVDFKDRYATFTVNTRQRVPVSMSILAMPNKTKYIVNEDFDPKGLWVLVRYDNDTVRKISQEEKDGNNNSLLKYLDANDGNGKNLKTNLSSITVRYTENDVTLEKNISINVSDHTLTDIAITTPAKNLYYDSGNAFDPTGMVVKAFFDGASTENPQNETAIKEKKIVGLASEDYTIRRSDEATEDLLPGSKTTIYGPKDQIIIKADDQAKYAKTHGYAIINLTSLPAGSKTTLGDSGSWTYTEYGKTNTVSGKIVGNEYVIVSYTYKGVTKEDQLPIWAGPKTLTSIKMETPPYKLNYYVGQIFDANGLTVKASYSDGSEANILPKSTGSNGWFLMKTGDVDPTNLALNVKTVTVGYTEDYETVYHRNTYSNGKLTKTETRTINIDGVNVAVANIDSVSVYYTGGKIYQGSYVKTKTAIDNGDVQVTVTFKDGSSYTYYATSEQVYRDDSPERANTQVTKTGENKFFVPVNSYDDAGNAITIKGEFIVEGITNRPIEDFSTSVAKHKRDNASWTEVFRSKKIKAINDYIDGYINNQYYTYNESGEITTGNTKEMSSIEMQGQVDNRTTLRSIEGTESKDKGTLKSPLLSFMRQGTQRQPETRLSISYRAHTPGFLYPNQNALYTNNTTTTDFSADHSYMPRGYWDSAEGYDTLYDNNQSLRNVTGQSDWVNNGDSTGANAKRIAFNYNVEHRTNPEMVDTHMDGLQIKLKNIENGTTAGLNIQYMQKGTTTQKTAEVIHANGETIYNLVNPWKLKIKLTGKVSVITKVDTNGNIQERSLVDFGKVYKLFYRTGDNDLAQQMQAGVNTDGGEVSTDSANTTFEMIEFKLMLIDAEFNTGTTTNKPIIESYPKNASVEVGRSAAFSVKAIGQGLSYQQYKATTPGQNSGGTLVNDVNAHGANTSTLRIDNVQAISAGQNYNEYYCVISKPTPDGKTSQVVTPTVRLVVTRAEPVLIQVPNTNISGNVGDLVKITGLVAKSGDLGGITYEQQYGDGGTGQTKFADAANNGAELSFVLKREYHGRYIRCKITAVNEKNADLSKSIYTDPIQIDCKVAPSVKIAMASNYMTKSKASNQILAQVTASGTGTIFYRQFIREDGGSQVDQGKNTSSLAYIPSEVGTFEVKVEVTDQTHPELGVGTATDVIKVGISPKISKITTTSKVGTKQDLRTISAIAEIEKSDLGNIEYTQSIDGEKVATTKENKINFTDLKLGQHVITCIAADEFGDSTATQPITCK